MRLRFLQRTPALAFVNQSARAHFRRASAPFRFGTDLGSPITQSALQIRQKLPRWLLLRQTMKRAKSPHQIHCMDANHGASWK